MNLFHNTGLNSTCKISSKILCNYCYLWLTDVLSKGLILGIRKTQTYQAVNKFYLFLFLFFQLT